MKKYGKDYPETHGKAEKPEDKSKHIYVTDLPEINHKMLKTICRHLGIDTSWIRRDYAKTKREQYEQHGLKHDE